MPIEEHILNYALLSKDIDIDIPGTQMTSIFEGQLHKTRPFPTKTRGPIWVPGIYIHIYIYIHRKYPPDRIPCRA